MTRRARDCSTGVPLLFFCVLWPFRNDLTKIVQEVDKQDRRLQRSTTVKSLVSQLSEEEATAATKVRRKSKLSIQALSQRRSWLAFFFERYRPGCWWTRVFLVVVRLLQTSLAVFFRDQTILTTYATCTALLAICVQRELKPYRRNTDNTVALLASWLVFCWCFVMQMYVVGALDWLPVVVVGIIVLIPTALTITVAARTAWSDLKRELPELFDFDDLTSQIEGKMTNLRRQMEIQMDGSNEGRRPSTFGSSILLPGLSERKPESETDSLPQEIEETNAERDLEIEVSVVARLDASSDGAGANEAPPDTDVPRTVCL